MVPFTVCKPVPKAGPAHLPAYQWLGGRTPFVDQISLVKHWAAPLGLVYDFVWRERDAPS